jgi:hypothetical protein
MATSELTQVMPRFNCPFPPSLFVIAVKLPAVHIFGELGNYMLNCIFTHEWVKPLFVSTLAFDCVKRYVLVIFLVNPVVLSRIVGKVCT